MAKLKWDREKQCIEEIEYNPPPRHLPQELTGDVAARMKRDGWRILIVPVSGESKWMKVNADGVIVSREDEPTWDEDLRAAEAEVRDVSRETDGEVELRSDVDWEADLDRSIASCRRAAGHARETWHVDVAVAFDAAAESMRAVRDQVIAALASRTDLDRRVTCYADGIDWQHEIRGSADGVTLYPSVGALEDHVGHDLSECGIVEVEVHLVRWVEPQGVGLDWSRILIDRVVP